jgi:hypothetical protein
VSIFSAALEILYAGEGSSRNASAIAMEPRVVDLDLDQFCTKVEDYGILLAYMFITVFFSPLRRSGRKARETICGAVVLTFNTSVRLSL